MYAQNYGLAYTVLRYPNVYGPRQDPHGEAGVVAIFAGQMLSGEQVVINGDGEQKRDFVHVADCANANLLALTLEDSGIFNIGSGVGTTINQVFATLKELTHYPLEPVYGPPILGETREIFLEASKANRILNWKPELSLKQGMASTVDYFLKEEVGDRQGA
jgi:UDP-glucose 4-epimerase